MKRIFKSEKGITLMALVITIIVLFILAGIGIGAITGVRQNVKESQSAITKSDIIKIQQAVMENYIKYKQIGNVSLLKGTQITYAEAQTKLATVDSEESLKVASYDGIAETDAGLFYYKLQANDLKNMGFDNIGTDEYIVNYSTGEVFDITNTKTATGESLYVYGK